MLYEIYDANGIYVGEEVLKNINGDYIGFITGKIYQHEFYSENKSRKACVKQIVRDNIVNMYTQFGNSNLYKGQSTKIKYLGCIVDVIYAFDYQGQKVYKCKTLEKYFLEDELQMMD